MKITISVTQKDIDKGIRCNSILCPVARAIRRRIKPNLFMRVSSQWIHIDNKVLLFSDKVKEFIRKYDYKEKVKPFRFSVDIPNKYLRKAKCTSK